MAYTDHGQGPVVVTLHGLPGSVRDFRWLGAALPDVRLVRLDQPGFGGTPTATFPGVALFERADFILQVVKSLGVKRCVVLGHSMGGALAAACAQRGPDMVGGLALLASVGLRPHALLRRMVARERWAGWVDRPLRGPLVKRVMRYALQRNGFSSNLTLEETAHMIRIGSAVDFSVLNPLFRGLTVPTLGAHAADDPAVEGAVGQELWPVLPPGPRLWFETGGHNIQKTHAVELGQALRDFAHAHGAVG